MQAVAIVGVANLFPGTKTPEEFWQNLLDKKDSRSQIDEADIGVHISEYMGMQGDVDKFYCQRGGYVRDFAFSADDFDLSQEQLTGLDDLYLWSLFAANEALKDAGILGDKELLERCGVVLGNLSFPTKASNYLFMPLYKQVVESSLRKLGLPKDFKLNSFSSAGGEHYSDENMLVAGYPAALISRALGLGDVSFALDAACASSCYSVKLACDYLNTGKADVMLAGAVSAADPMFINMGFSIFHAYPKNEKSAPLDTNSQGLFAGEGAGFFVLKRYEDALKDGDTIHALVRGGGLSNDGKGEFVLSPNTKGQVLAYERAYEDAHVDPSTIQLVECHATGTPKGDRVELTSMGNFFGRYKSKPLLGAVKSNVSHLLTAAGMPGMLKVIMGMNKGVLPPTINIEEPVEAKDKYFSLDDIPTSVIDWPLTQNSLPRRAGVSTFGFGGSNAHLVFEEYVGQQIPKDENFPAPKSLAIISMASHFGPCSDLEQFKQLILNGESAFLPLPTNRWRGLDQDKALLEQQGLHINQTPLGAYVESFDVDFMYFKIPPTKSDALIPQQLLLLKVADEAVHQAQLQPGANVAVLVAMGVELDLHRYRGRVNLHTQIKDALTEQGVELTDAELEKLLQISKDAVHGVASISQYTSFIGNIMASRVSALWDFSGPSLTISAEENSVFQCLDVAENLFATSDVEAVVIAAVDLAGSAEHVILRNRMQPVSVAPESQDGWYIGEGAGAIVVQPYEYVDTEKNEVIARIDATCIRRDIAQKSLAHAAWKNFETAQCTPEDIAYVEMNDSGFEESDVAESFMLSSVYMHKPTMGSVKSNIGHTFAASGMASLIKVASCLSERKIPVSPVTSRSPAMEQSALDWPTGKRAAIHSFGMDGRAAHVIMSAAGRMRNVKREKPKRELIRQVFLGESRMQDDILHLENFQFFSDLAARCNQNTNDIVMPTLSGSTNNIKHEIVNRDSVMPDIKLPSLSALPASLDVPLGGFFPASSTLNMAAPITFEEVDKKLILKPIVLKEDYTTPENIIWDTADLIEFAEGDIANVFGEEFAVIDSYSRRVRLPTTDYLLVSRVTELNATPHRYEPCMMVTEYDIPLNAPYLVDGQIAWSVCVESGQCDLLLISYLGIDFQNKGERVYRLLDCTLTFLDEMAFGGQTLRYEIHIDAFANQGDTLLFFFHYDCYVKDKKVLEMRGGCAGFFTDKELAVGKGVVRTVKEKEERQRIVKQTFDPFLRCEKTEFTREDISQIISGDVAACFGANYDQGGLNPSLQFASDKFLMIDHITSVNPTGGDWGLGLVESYKILEPDHWYFPCHFKDDEVMAGSLMSDGCGQLVMFFMLYLGMQSTTKNARFQPIFGEPQKVRCRGQVTPQSGRLHYRMEVFEIGMKPYPYVRANVEIILNGKVVVDFQNLGVYMKEQQPNQPYARDLSSSANSSDVLPSVSNVHAPLMRVENDLAAPKNKGVIPIKHFEAPVVEGQNRIPDTFPFTPYHFFEFATGTIAKCFGEEFSFYDHRIPPRTPCGDLQLTSRVLSVDGKRGELKKVSHCVAEYEVPQDAWYFKKNTHQAIMPYSILMEIALQPNGFLSAYLGSTLVAKDKDLYFRNLDGSGEILRHVDLRGKTITNNTTMLSTSILGANIIQTFTFDLLTDGEVFYKGSAAFGYFSEDALTHQLGLDKGEKTQPWHILNGKSAERINLTDANNEFYTSKPGKPSYRLAPGQLNFIDTVDIVEGGGDFSKGYIYAERQIDPSDWFFQFHFHQDPVMPGSLGVQAIIEAMQAYMLKNDLGSKLKNPRFAQPKTKVVWKYRGQISPLNRQMSLDIHITDIIHEQDRVTLIGNANLSKDNLRIYEVKDIVVCLEESV